MSEETKDTRVHRRMAIKKYPLNGRAVKRLTAAGMTWLNTNKQQVNALNVFPVPDGDTGTNMMLTMQSAFEEIENSPEKHAGKMFGSVAQGALMGARGNSGVILSQIWRGFAIALEEEEFITAKGLAKAFSSARDTAYRGVVKPVEGTMLTVIKDVAAATNEGSKNTDDPYEILQIAVDAAEKSVENTPELLPVLKEAGVVDSGGMGVQYLLEGMMRWVVGEPLDIPVAGVISLTAFDLETTLDAVEEGQDFEIVVDFKPNGPLELDKFYAKLEEIGTSIQIGEGEGMYRMHIHVPTENRYMPIDCCMDFGTVTNVAIENLLAQMEELEQAAKQKIDLTPLEPGQIAAIVVSPGKGISKVFASLGATAIVEGGQTMNPSTADIMATFENLPTNDVVILPNNKNIILAAEAAAEMTVKNVKVIKSRTIPQGLSAMLRLAPEEDFEKVTSAMETALSDVVTGEITTATRDVEIDGVKVKHGQIIALLDGKLVLSEKSLEKGCLGLLKKIEMDNYEIITLFHGNNIQPGEVEKIAAKIGKAYPDHEIEIQEGGQPHYQFIFAIE